MTTFTTVAQIEAAETKDLIAFYNSVNVDKPVKKFTDRTTAIKRCIALLAAENEEAAAIDAANEEPAPTDEEKAAADKNFVWPFKKASELAADEKGSAPSAVNEEKAKPVTRKPSSHASNAAGVAASWCDPDVAAARLTRDGVQVAVGDDVRTFKSTRDAFRALRLMDSKHIRFRGQLKAAGTATYTENGVNYVFTII